MCITHFHLIHNKRKHYIFIGNYGVIDVYLISLIAHMYVFIFHLNWWFINN